MASAKRSISFDPQLLAAAEEVAAAPPYAGNLSGLVSDALIHHLKLRGLHELVADFEREHGPLSPEDLAQAEASWPA